MSRLLISLGWTLLHVCWQAVAIGLVYSRIERNVSPSNRQLKYTLGLAALVGIFIVATITFGYQIASTEGSNYGNLRRSGLITSTGFEVSTQLALLSNPSSFFVPGRAWIESSLSWAAALWLTIIFGMAIQTGVGSHRLHKRIKSYGRPPQAIADLLITLCDRIGVQKMPVLCISSDALGPFTLGALRAVIVLPVCLVTALSEQQLRAVLAHELAHIRRADYAWNLLQTAIETLFFFHPVVRWIGQRIRDERELCCDDLVLQTGTDPMAYATALFDLAGSTNTQQVLLQAWHGTAGASLTRRRVAHVLGLPVPRGHRPPLAKAAIAGLVGSALLLVSLGHGRDAPVGSGDGRPTAAVTLSRPHPSRMDPWAGAASAKVALASLPPATAAPAVGGPLPDSAATRDSGFAGPPAPSRLAVSAAAQVSTKRADDPEVGLATIRDDQQGTSTDTVNDNLHSYSDSLEALGLGTPTLAQLRRLRRAGATASDFEQLRKSGLPPTTIGEFVAYTERGVTPEFLVEIQTGGFEDLRPGRLIKMASLGMLASEAVDARRAEPNITLYEVIRRRIAAEQVVRDNSAIYPPRA